jgi:hypothetical protein
MVVHELYGISWDEFSPALPAHSADADLSELDLKYALHVRLSSLA